MAKPTFKIETPHPSKFLDDKQLDFRKEHPSQLAADKPVGIMQKSNLAASLDSLEDPKGDLVRELSRDSRDEAVPEPRSRQPSIIDTSVKHAKQPSVHAHFKLDEVDQHARSRSGSASGRNPISPTLQTPKQISIVESTTHSNPAGGHPPPTEIPIARRQSTVVPAEETQQGDPRLPQDDGKIHILLGGTGSVSTSKLRLIVNKLEEIYGRDRVAIQIVLTSAAEHFVSRGEFHTDVILWRDKDEWSTWKSRSDPVLHIELRRWADILVICPLSANTLSKIAIGLCDNLLTNVVRAWNTQYPILVAPSMTSYAYNSPVTKRHLKVIKEEMPWIEVLRPVEKVVGSYGEIGMGGMMDWNEIVDKIVLKLGGYPEEDDDDNGDDDNGDDDNGDDIDLDNVDNDDNDDDDNDDDDDDDDNADDDDDLRAKRERRQTRKALNKLDYDYDEDEMDKVINKLSLADQDEMMRRKFSLRESSSFTG
ncbi:Protein SIS2 [Yarrowia sp. B02]|nr:Protein SIS2 [Yarrowia sp. B02]